MTTCSSAVTLTIWSKLEALSFEFFLPDRKSACGGACIVKSACLQGISEGTVLSSYCLNDIYVNKHSPPCSYCFKLSSCQSQQGLECNMSQKNKTKPRKKENPPETLHSDWTRRYVTSQEIQLTFGNSQAVSFQSFYCATETTEDCTRDTYVIRPHPEIN